MVVGDVGLGLADHGDQGGLAHVGEAHQAHVRQQLQLQLDLQLLAGGAGLGEPGHLPGGGGKVGVAPAALAALGDDLGLVAGHVRQQAAGLGVLDKGAAGHGDHQVRGAFAKAPVAPAVLPPLGGVLALVAEIRQSGEVVVHLEHNAAAPAAVAPIGTAGGHVLLPVEGDGAVSPVPGFDFDFRGIDEHSAAPFCFKKKASSGSA